MYEDLNKFEQKMTDLSAKSKKIDTSLLLNEFYENLNLYDNLAGGCKADGLPIAIETYQNILLQLPYSDLQESIKHIYETRPEFITRDSLLITAVIKKHPKIAEFLFNTLFEKLPASDANSVYIVLKSLFTIIKNADKKTSALLADKILNTPQNIQKIIREQYIAGLYIDAPHLRKKLFKIMTDNSIDNYANFVKIIQHDKSIAKACLNMTEQDLKNHLLNQETVSQMILLLVALSEIPGTKKQSTELLKQLSKQKSLLTATSFRNASRKLGNTQELRSSFQIGKRVPKTETNKSGWQTTNTIPINEPSVLFLGGDGTLGAQQANGYAKQIERLFNNNNLTENIGIYSIAYDFGDTSRDPNFANNPKTSRNILMQQHGRKTKPKKSTSIDDINPRYIQQIFDTIFLPRISKNNERISTSDAIQNIRNITIAAHCHGGYTFLKLEELMQNKMIELGYTSAERSEIQQQLLCVAYAPYCPLGVSKSTFISFASVNDFEVEHNNFFHSNIQLTAANNDFEIAWFPDKQGNFFMVKNLYEKHFSDHDFHGFPENISYFSKGGKILIIFESNAIINSVKSAIKKTKISSVKELVTGGDDSLGLEFETAKQNGATIYKQILDNAKRISAPALTKGL